MTNTLAIFLGICVAAFIAADLAFDWNAGLFLLKELVKLIDFLSFWR